MPLKRRPIFRPPAANRSPWLKIGDAAALAGVSASVLRSWERLGLVRPQRTDSRYRLYTPDDVRLLRRARFLRRQRGLNVRAILDMLKREGALRKTSRQDSESGPAALGPILRRLRDQRGLSLQKVAQAVGISVGFLSALERSQMSASVGTMRRLARFYKINILDMFEAGGSNPRLVRPPDRKRLNAGRGVRMDLLAWGNTVMEPHLFRIAPSAGSGESYSHHGEEFLYVMRGELAIELEGEHYRLKPGDSFYFDSSTTHQWSNPGKRETWVLWINTPPTF
jgi:DNA-binding transcriptional MerR regulator/mannose-6-phosphate isomerase-like protein (cupin superfamily)